MMMSSNSIEFVCRFEFEYNGRNQHCKLPLHTEFQLYALLCYQDNGNFMFLLSSNPIEFVS